MNQPNHKTVAELLDWAESKDLIKIEDGPWVGHHNKTLASICYALCCGQQGVRPIRRDGTPGLMITVFSFRDGSMGHFDREMDGWSDPKSERYIPFRQIFQAIPAPELAKRLVAQHAL